MAKAARFNSRLGYFRCSSTRRAHRRVTFCRAEGSPSRRPRFDSWHRNHFFLRRNLPCDSSPGAKSSATKLGDKACPYLRRWAIAIDRFASIRLHHWHSGDDPRNFHDHPWDFVTIVLWGAYTDVTESGEERMTPGTIRYRPALHRHTVRVDKGGCWTLLLTGKVVRKWGFWVKGKFKKANKYFLEHGHHPCK